MRLLVISLLAILVGLGTVLAQGQRKQDPADVVVDIQLQLIDLTAKEEDLKLQAQQLDEALKPENIERSLAGFGSTRPEELREQRRRELTVEKARVTAQQEQLSLQRARLETNLAAAQVEAYQQSARGTVPMENYFGFSVKRSTRVAMSLALVFVLVAASVALLIIKYRLNRGAIKD